MKKHKERMERERQEAEARKRKSMRGFVLIFVVVGIAFVLFRVLWTSPSDGEGTASSSGVEGASSSASSATSDEEGWNLILVNQEHVFPEDATISMIKLPDTEYLLETHAAAYAWKMMEDAKKDGVTLTVCSAYRDFQTQQKLYNRESPASPGQPVAVQAPGESEHHTGLAVDFITPDYPHVEEGFEKTKAFAWLQKHAEDYGYILRYPKEKEAITGVIYEPWHYRYVGEKHAKIINEKNLCLEEYLQEKGVKGE